MKVTAVTAPDAASDPKHPDHDRWVKETTLAMEVRHAQIMGGTFRDAEAENIRLLERAEALARNAKPAAAKPRADRKQRIADRGVTARHAAPAVHISKLSPCGRCGVCRNCKREKRVYLIIQNRKTDKLCASLADEMFLSALRINAGMGEFRFMGKAERDRAITVKAESVCDRSVKRFGAWQ